MPLARRSQSAAPLLHSASARQAAGQSIRTARPLPSSGPREHRWNGAQQDFQVEPKGPIVDVFQIQAHPFLEVAHLISPTHLPQTGKPGTHAQAPAVGWVIKSTHFIYWQRTRPHETHLAAKDVEELG